MIDDCTATITHYRDEACSRYDTFEGEYTPYGVKFASEDFSPFVVDCSARADTPDDNGENTDGSKNHRDVIRRFPAKTEAESGTEVDSAKTFDGGVAVYAALALVSAGGMTLMRRKRED